jgi:hypothetical protein
MDRHSFTTPMLGLLLIVGLAVGCSPPGEPTPTAETKVESSSTTVAKAETQDVTLSVTGMT